MLYPLTFHPLLKERVWGGRKLQQLYNKALPAGVPIGESWEISDRPGDISVIANGHLAGKDLHCLVEREGQNLLGSARLHNDRFPLLIKILDAQGRLSLQVHPPAASASRLGGGPKTEMWVITDAAPDAELYVGLRRGTSRAGFERSLQSGRVADLFHRVKVRAGDVMFLPSGRVHAIGAGLVLFEIQQNSDTTYRVYDWGRVGLDGKPRSLHITESLASIDFADFEPALIPRALEKHGSLGRRALVQHPLFSVQLFQALERLTVHSTNTQRAQVIGVVEGRLSISSKAPELNLRPGDFCLLPAALRAELHLQRGTSILLAEPG